MAIDPFEELLSLEDKFYQEGYESGIVDSAYAGMVEGKVFGIEKGYEKALELSRLHGRSLVWQNQTTAIDNSSDRINSTPISRRLKQGLRQLQDKSRLHKHVEFLVSVSDGTKLSPENSDDAVAQFDDQIMKAKARAKIISNTVGESLSTGDLTNNGIEDATGLNARQ